jgi:hypothetical protein
MGLGFGAVITVTLVPPDINATWGWLFWPSLIGGVVGLAIFVIGGTVVLRSPKESQTRTQLAKLFPRVSKNRMDQARERALKATEQDSGPERHDHGE